ncbi:hypothetical protein BDZ45DRAFT_166917 [Acephala macrosclerotiorum]|nr:hypothetical protein BDZ45DRAFT_166917 [Acephala macrosclerotiorum]
MKRELPADVEVKEKMTGSLEDWPTRDVKAVDEDVKKRWDAMAVDDKDLISLGGNVGFGDEVIVVKQEHDAARAVSPSMKQENISIGDSDEVGVGGLIEEGSDQLNILDDILQVQSKTKSCKTSCAWYGVIGFGHSWDGSHNFCTSQTSMTWKEGEELCAKEMGNV